MLVTVSMETQSTVVLEEPDDFSRFHVAARGGRDGSRLADALTAAGAGELDGDDVLVRVAWLRDAAAGRVTEEWEQGFAAMLAYAERKGWLERAGTAVRAHVEWGDAAQ